MLKRARELFLFPLFLFFLPFTQRVNEFGSYRRIIALCFSILGGARKESREPFMYICNELCNTRRKPWSKEKKNLLSLSVFYFYSLQLQSSREKMPIQRWAVQAVGTSERGRLPSMPTLHRWQALSLLPGGLLQRSSETDHPPQGLQTWVAFTSVTNCGQTVAEYTMIRYFVERSV